MYKSFIETGSKVILPVIDVSNNIINKELIEWIRRNRNKELVNER
jgi:hypothetical protein